MELELQVSHNLDKHVLLIVFNFVEFSVHITTLLYWIGALLRCKEILLSKNISVTGIDYNELYVKAAQESIEQNNLTSSIEVEYKSVYDIPTHPPIILTLPNDKNKKRYFDAAYFSGSISLLPSSVEALRAVAEVVKPGGLIYITQTYQRKSLPLLKYIKPLLKFVTSIDFGQLVMIDEVEERLWRGSGLNLIKHEVIPGSVDNRYQAAYLTILKVPNRIVSQ